MAPHDLPPELEAELLAILLRPLAPGETHQTGNAARERELCEVLARLSPAQALALLPRLDRAAPSDELGTAFQRLIPERRLRLRTFLSDTRRRQATTRR
jgi:hypothetical protein